MKLLIIDTSPVIGGAETYLLELSKFLSKKHRLFFVLSPKNLFVPDFKQLGKVIFLETGESVEKWRGLNLFSPKNQLYRDRLKTEIASFDEDFDLVFFAGYLKDLFLFNALFNTPQIYIFHTPPPGWLAKPPFKNLFAEASKNFVKIIAVSESNARWLSRIISKEKIITIKNGVDIKKFSPVKIKEKEKIRAQISLPLDKIIIGNTSRIHKAKGQRKLVKIFAGLVKKYPNISLLLVGEGSAKAAKALDKEIRRYKLQRDVFWFGFQKEIDKFYRAMDIFALPSLSENMPLTVLEAMAAGVPAVTFNIAGVSEEIDDKKNGFLIEPNNLSKFQKKLEILINNAELRKKFSQQARQKVEKEFNQENTFAGVETLIQKTGEIN